MGLEQKPDSAWQGSPLSPDVGKGRPARARLAQSRPHPEKSYFKARSQFEPFESNSGHRGRGQRGALQRLRQRQLGD